MPVKSAKRSNDGNVSVLKDPLKQIRLNEAAAREFYAVGHWSNRTFYDVLKARAASDPDREVFKDSRHSLTYAELKARVERCAEFLRRQGIGRGDVVAVQLPNRIEFPVLMFSLELIGAVANNLNPDFRSVEVEYILRVSQAKAYLCASKDTKFDYLAMIGALRPKLPSLDIVIPVDSESGDGPSFAEALKSGLPISERDQVRMAPDEVMRLAFTSGTTGNPKGVMHSFNTTLCTAEVMNKNMKLTSADVLLVFMPVGLNSGYIQLLQVVMAGARAVLMERFNPAAALAIIRSERVTAFVSPPTALVMLLQVPDFASYNLNTLRLIRSGGASASVETLRAIKAAVPAAIMNSYGMLETGFHAHTRPDDDFETVVGTVGRVLDNMGLRIVDDAGRDVPFGEEGEILAYGPSLLLGYFNQPDATAASFTSDGWFRTGDLGQFVDQAGNLRISGRRKEIINRAGKKYLPREIEELLFQHPKVVDVAVIGIPDPRLGERNCACVIAKPGATLELPELVEFLRGKVADYKLPEQLVQMRAFPLTATGKVMRSALVAEVSGDSGETGPKS